MRIAASWEMALRLYGVRRIIFAEISSGGMEIVMYPIFPHFFKPSNSASRWAAVSCLESVEHVAVAWETEELPHSGG